MESIKQILSEQGLNTPHPPIMTTEKAAGASEQVKCRYCNDAGVVHPRLPDGKVDWANVMPCRYCIPPEKICRFLRISSIEKTLGNVKPVKGISEALKYSRQIVTMKTPWKLMLIYGTYGNGKTMLLEGIAIELWKRGYLAPIQTFPAFMDSLKATFDQGRRENNDLTFKSLLERITNMPFLLMDDVGLADSYTDFSKEQLEKIMLVRYRENLFTVMTTNRDLTELPPSVLSRLKDSEKARLVLNSAADYRPLKGRG